jgi:signal transduction histidine kinase
MISRLDKSFHQIKQFSTDASHELKTPLTILKGEVEVALRKERAAQEYEQILRSNLEEINRMSTIVEDLLLLSKTEFEEVPLHKEKFSLTEILHDVVVQVTILAQAKQIHIQMSNPDGDIAVLGDALRIRELLLNLIENGIKYTPERGSVTITLETEKNLDASTGEPIGFVKMMVSDTGIGIEKKDQEKIFDRFFRVDKSRSREQGGSGLGLSICKWIVEAHHGEISVESELGKGSSFVVKLPLFYS